MAAVVHFAREIDGLPIVGMGASSARVELIAGGEVESLTFDWPPLVIDRNSRVPLVNSTELSERARLVGEGAKTDFALCGFLDDRAGRAVGAWLQPGCLVQFQGDTPIRLTILAHNKMPAQQGAEPTTSRASLEPQKSEEPAGPLESPPSNAGCNAAGTHQQMAGAGFLAALIALFIVRRTRRRVVLTAGVLCCLCVPHSSEAATYRTYMYKDYQHGWQSSFSSTQWTNYSDWKNEMDDIATCSHCTSPSQISSYLHGGSAFASDLLAVATHGTNRNSSGGFDGVLTGWAQGNEAYSRQITPASSNLGATEIALFSVCSFMPRTDRIHAWDAFRNMFRGGLHVAAGCWGAAGAGSCSLTKTLFNSTWNEIGDEIADSSSTIWTAWKEGYSVYYASDNIVIWGSGRRSLSNCDDVAYGVKFQNRDSFVDYIYPLNDNSGVYELCGYNRADW